MLFITSEQREDDCGSGWRSGSAFDEPVEEEDITSSSCLIRESSFWPPLPLFPTCAPEHNPYVYHYSNGSDIPFGRLDNVTGLCIYEEANCSLHHLPGASQCVPIGQLRQRTSPPAAAL